MKISDDLTALIFELQRARSPRDKARAMARAWRTIRRLNPTERRLLAREVGFDGAEDLVEGLAGKSGGAFAPAAVLEAIGRMRKDEGLTLRSILADLKDPDRREDLLERGIDLIAGDERDETSAEIDKTLDTDQMAGPGSAEQSASVFGSADPFQDDGDQAGEVLAQTEDELSPIEPAPPPPPPEAESTHESLSEHESDLIPDPDSEPVVGEEGDASWDEMWLQAPSAAVTPVTDARKLVTRISGDPGQSREAMGSVLNRLRAFREGIGALRDGGAAAVFNALDSLPEPWARRRAMVALIEAGIPTEVDDTLDLIAELERPMDRRWCLSALAGRGELVGADLERAVAMLASPAARRRLRALAEAAN